MVDHIYLSANMDENLFVLCFDDKQQLLHYGNPHSGKRERDRRTWMVQHVDMDNHRYPYGKQDDERTTYDDKICHSVLRHVHIRICREIRGQNRYHVPDRGTYKYMGIYIQCLYYFESGKQLYHERHNHRVCNISHDFWKNLYTYRDLYPDDQQHSYCKQDEQHN